MPPICAAARQYQDGLELCEALLNAGALVNEADEDGRTALVHAVESTNVALCRFLIDQGADVTVETRHGRTPLFLAAVESGPRSLAIVKMLICAGASSSRMPIGRHPLEPAPLTPFQAAVARNVADKVAFFLHHCGENPGQNTMNGRTMFDLTDKANLHELLNSALAERAVTSAISEDPSPALRSKPTNKGIAPL